MPEWLIKILEKTPELASVIVVVYFAMSMAKQHSDSASTVMESWKEFLTMQEQRWRESLAVYNDKWSSFLSSQQSEFLSTLQAIRSQNMDTNNRLADEMRELAKQVAANNALVINMKATSEEPTRRRPQN